MKINIPSLIIILILLLVVIGEASFSMFQLGEKEGLSKGLIEGTKIGFIRGANDSFTNIQATILWVEYMNHFYTNDIDRAQQHIPFTLLLPGYIPTKEHNQPIPAIEGTLNTSPNIKPEVMIKYGAWPAGYISIKESTYPNVLEYPESNESYEQIEIDGKHTVIIKEKTSPLNNCSFSFKGGDIYFIVDILNVSHEEALKVVDSMLQQIK
jgi:hypothetical protein